MQPAVVEAGVVGISGHEQDAEQAELWTLYEGTVAYVASRPDLRVADSSTFDDR